MSSENKLIIFDCDSTLSEIEGVDELAALRDSSIKAKVVEATHRAMAGEIPISAVFKERLDIIRPTQSECQEIGQRYIQQIEPTAIDTISKLQQSGWTVVILSGGFVPVIDPLARLLNINHIEAVPLFFDPSGNYIGFDENYPTTRNGGKLEIVEQLKKSYQPTKTIMVGDGVSDLETKPGVDRFIGFGKYAVRDKVKSEADAFIFSLKDVFLHI